MFRTYDDWRTSDHTEDEPTGCLWCGCNCTRDYCSDECEKLDMIYLQAEREEQRKRALAKSSK